MPMKDQRLTRRLFCNSVHIICLNEADAFLDANEDKSKELMVLLIRHGYKGIVNCMFRSRQPERQRQFGKIHFGQVDCRQDPSSRDTARTRKLSPDESRGGFPKIKESPNPHFDHRHVTRAGLPYAIIAVFHVHPSISYGAQRERDFQPSIMPLVTEHMCDAIAGGGNKSV